MSGASLRPIEPANLLLLLLLSKGGDGLDLPPNILLYCCSSCRQCHGRIRLRRPFLLQIARVDLDRVVWIIRLMTVNVIDGLFGRLRCRWLRWFERLEAFRVDLVLCHLQVTIVVARALRYQSRMRLLFQRAYRWLVHILAFVDASKGRLINRRFLSHLYCIR